MNEYVVSFHIITPSGKIFPHTWKVEVETEEAAKERHYIYVKYFSVILLKLILL